MGGVEGEERLLRSREELDIRQKKVKRMHQLIKISQFHNHAQYVQAVCLTGHTSCKYGGLYE